MSDKLSRLVRLLVRVRPNWANLARNRHDFESIRAHIRSNRLTTVRPFFMATDFITGEEFAARRERVLTELDGAVALVLAGDASGGTFTADAHFVYLTGLVGEAGASVLFDGNNPQPERRITLLLRPLNTE
ncbi:MAG TPA: hypothetical protein VF595_08600, partial [Tepidisphaeraceae bacterium]